MRSVLGGATVCLVSCSAAQLGWEREKRPHEADAPRVHAAAPTPHHAAAPAESEPELVEGLGRHHHPIATEHEDAQAFFDQGMSWVFAFNHDEAVRSFARAAELDPQAAMPHWGIAWALGPNYNLDVDDAREKRAYYEVQTAKALAAGGPPEERAYVAAMAVRFSVDPKADRAKLASNYAAAMRDLSRRYPDDLDAA